MSDRRAIVDDRAAGLRTRRAALGILLKVERERAFADVLLGHRLNAFSPPDRRLVTQLVLGTLAWRGRLDYELEQIASRSIDQINPAILTILRMGLHQLRILTRIPAHAAVDTAVTLAGEITGGEKAARFVNAVLRNALRRPIQMPARHDDEIEYLAVVYSHPRWLVEKFLQWFGPAETEKLLAANNEAAPNALRMNLKRGSAEQIAAMIESAGMHIARRGRFPETIMLEGAPDFASSGYRQGLFYPQSEASQLVAHLLAPTHGASVADCAAAPGGKTMHLAAMVGDGGRVVALDANFRGLNSAKALALRLGCPNVRFACCDAVSGIPLRPASVDYALLDAPCSGIGTLREHPEIRWRLQPGDFQRMAQIQLAMLTNAAELVRPGGAMVYSVCSFAPDEGIEVIAKFLAAHSDFAVDRRPARGREFAGILDRDGFMRTRPDRGGLDGFFAARLIRHA